MNTSMAEGSIPGQGLSRALEKPKTPTPPGGTLGWVGPYQLIERLPYQGGPIEYLARQRGPFGFERNCRLKLVPGTHGGDQRIAEAVAREARIVLRLDHPSIVRMYDLFEHGDNLVLVMEHFSALSLARLLELLAKQRKQLEESALWHVAHRLFDGLAHAHGIVNSAGLPTPVVHSDVRPANVLVASDGRVRLAGFGFARHGEMDDATACGQLGHGASYVAPEQVRGGHLTERVDTFSAALIVWELLTGRAATPEGMGDVDRLRYLSRRQLDPLRGLRPDLPPLVTTAIDACLTVDPAERTIQAAEVAGCIGAAMDLGMGERALRHAVVSLGAMWEGLAAGDPASSPAPRVGKSVPPAAKRGPAFSVVDHPVVAPSLTAAPLRDAPPVWDEVTRVPEPKSELVDPPRSSPAATIAARSEPPRALAPSLAPLTAPLPASTPEPTREHHRAGPPRQWILAVPVAMVAGVLAFAAFRTSAPSRTVATGHPVVAQTSVTPPGPVATATASATQRAALPIPATTPSPIPRDRAVIVVQGPPEGWVYLQGVVAGKTGQPIETNCGSRFVRVGTELDENGMQGVTWLAEGRGVLLRCGEKLVLSATK